MAAKTDPAVPAGPDEVFLTASTPVYEVRPPTPAALQAAVSAGWDGAGGNPHVFAFALEGGVSGSADDAYLQLLFDSGIPVAGRAGAKVLSPWSGGGGFVADSNEEDPVDASARVAAAPPQQGWLSRADAALQYAIQAGKMTLAEWLVESKGADPTRPELLYAACKAPFEVFRDQAIPFLETRGHLDWANVPPTVAKSVFSSTLSTDMFEFLLSKLPAGVFDGAAATQLAFEFAKGYHEQPAMYLIEHHAADAAVLNERFATLAREGGCEVGEYPEYPLVQPQRGAAA